MDETCDCPCCTRFTRGAIRHYFMANEMLGPILLSLHNVRFYQRLMADVRQCWRKIVSSRSADPTRRAARSGPARRARLRRREAATVASCLLRSYWTPSKPVIGTIEAKGLGVVALK